MQQIRISNLEELQDAVRANVRIQVVGLRSKWNPHLASHTTTVIDMSDWSGILEYDPSEFTITVRSGTPVAEVQARLAEHGQFLPFDPPLVQRGSTMGGLVAAGVTGPTRLRYGGIRDFILGMRYVDGEGGHITAGGKVVKNAAGFDIPKLMVGSWGKLGIMTELTFKVFPRPRQYATVIFDLERLDEALAVQERLMASPLEIEALDIEPNESKIQVLVRVSGDRAASLAAAQRVQKLAGCDGRIGEEGEDRYWEGLREWTWHRQGDSLLRIPITHIDVAGLDQLLKPSGVPYRLSVASNLVWISWPDALDVERMQAWASQSQRVGRCLLGPLQSSELGRSKAGVFAERVALAMDAHRRFGA